MAPLFANHSCDPFAPRSSPCIVGSYVRYAVDARTPRHVQAALEFARQHRIRLVVRNTGHDTAGRSTGAGALAVWVHHMKDVAVVDDPTRSGEKALRLGAGVQGFEALAEASKAGLVVMTAACPTVGVAGAYTQGGGHSMLSTVHGLAADNVVSFEVVVPSGSLVETSRTVNPDLYWALTGGGGGTYGVVAAMTVRAYPDAKVSGASFEVTAPGDDVDRIFEAVDAFHAALPRIVDSGAMIVYHAGQGFITTLAMTMFNKTKSEAEVTLEPFFSSIAANGYTIEVNYTGFPSYHDHYSHYWGPIPGGKAQVNAQLFGGRLIPRQALPNLGVTFRRLVALGVTFKGIGLDVSRFGGANAVLPQWRESIIQASLALPWSYDRPFDDMVAEQKRITTQIQPLIEAATPGAGAYMNEGNFQQPDFQETFFGANYGRLLRIKKQYDPEGLLFAVGGVGSEEWTVQGDGRLCRVDG
ncbi:6-hydroxy-D-nicotine oxidase [Purpureocillium lavendulum]|uniref:6-hydroxy-D-nicotine oxidase n=1 Tax=Purpureocillium lavendulum TaxID=1247861 RepID=A0AB34FE39_9HYPO|nr:6-hydroxy-D-nicotine oxidase [Purpureocillium lavendulum]